MLYLYLYGIVFNDSSEDWQLGLQDPATPIAEGMSNFHDYLMFFILVIGIFVCYFLFQIVINFSEENNINVEKFIHFSVLEFIWTVIPAIILLFISILSFALLYSLDEALLYSLDELIEPLIFLEDCIMVLILLLEVVYGQAE
jgi:cytochrome c oxidase subunit 2